MKKIVTITITIAAALVAATRAEAQTPPPTYRELTAYCARAPIAGCEVVDRFCRRDPAVGVAELARLDPARCDLSALGGAGLRGGGAAAGGVAWVPVLTDVFLARAQAELGLFLQRRVGQRLCKGAVKTLLADTCAIIGGDDPSDASVVTLPRAIRGDLSALPERLLELGRDELQQVASSEKPSPRRLAACHVLAAWEAYPVLRDRGPLEALRQLGKHRPIPTCKDDVALTVAWSSVIAGVADDVIATPGDGSIDAATLRVALELALHQLVPTGLPADVDARVDAATPAVIELIHLLVDLSRHGQIDRARVARALQLATDLTVAIGGSDDTTLAHVMAATAALAAGRYTAAVAHLAALDVLGDRAHGAVKVLMRLGGLAAALAEAETDDEARAVIEAAAEPVGSYRAFREDGWKAFISGHAGVAGGIEAGIGDGEGVDRATTLVPVLPVGLEFGRPIFDRSSLNILVSAIDLGAVAAVRLGRAERDEGGMDGDVRRGADTGLAGVIAPGLFLAIGVGDSPFVIGAGAEYLPANRAVFDCDGAATCDATRSAPVFRAMAYVGIDLPLIRLSP